MSLHIEGISALGKGNYKCPQKNQSIWHVNSSRNTFLLKTFFYHPGIHIEMHGPRFPVTRGGHPPVRPPGTHAAHLSRETQRSPCSRRFRRAPSDSEHSRSGAEFSSLPVFLFVPAGCGSKLNSRGCAGSMFPLTRFHFGISFLSHSRLDEGLGVDVFAFSGLEEMNTDPLQVSMCELFWSKSCHRGQRSCSLGVPAPQS